MSRRRKAAMAAGIVLSAAMIAAFGIGPMLGQKEKEAESIAVETVLLTRQDLVKKLTLNATVESAGRKTVFADAADAKVISVNTSVGEYVEKGDTIAVLDTKELDDKIALLKENIQINQVKSEMEIKRQQRLLEETSENGTVVVERSERDVNTAYAEYQKALADKTEAEKKYQAAKEKRIRLEKRVQELDDVLGKAIKKSEKRGTYEPGKFTEKKEHLSQKETELNSARAKEDAAEEALKQMDTVIKNMYQSYEKTLDGFKDNIKNSSSSVLNQEDLLASAVYGKNSGLAQEKMDLRQLETKKAEYTILAPESGIVTSIYMKEGERFKGGEVCVVQDMGSLIIRASVGQQDISDVKKELKAVVTTETTGEQEMEGIVTFVSPVPKEVPEGKDNNAAANSGEYIIEAKLINPSERLRLGMNAKTRLILEQRDGVFAVPYTCLKKDENQKNYIQVLENGEVRNILVEKGLETDYYIEIKSSELKENMQIVISAETDEPLTEDALG